MRTKKTGTRNDAIGSISCSSACSPRLDEVAVVHVLEHEAGREGADDRRQADERWRATASTKQNARPDGQQDAAGLQPRGEREETRRQVDAQHERADEEAAALATTAADRRRTTARSPWLAAAMMPVTTARMTSPSTSSMTAAPRMMRASSVCDRPRSLSTRAVMPTLVARERRAEEDVRVRRSPAAAARRRRPSRARTGR